MKIAADNIKDFGNTEDIICPRCDKTVYMKLLKATNGIGVLNVPLLKLNIDLFAVCPECNAMFTVDPEIAQRAGKEKSNNYTMVNERNIKFLRDLK